MSLPEDDLLDAAEYALGTLDASERAAIAARRQREPELDAAIRSWEARLAPLAETVAAAAPPDGVFAAIERSINGEEAPGNVFVLQRDVRRWRFRALAASGIAAALAIGLATVALKRESGPREFVAVLQRDAQSPAFVVSVNIDKREFTVRPVSAQAQAGRSYQLWLIADTLGAPRSLGLISASPDVVTRGAPLSQYDAATVQRATYAVTVEPEGGSPTGQPSGPPVFVGKLIPVGD